MDYVKKLLGSDEQVLFRTHRHFFVIFGALFKELILIIAFGIALVFIPTWYSGDPMIFYIIVGVLILVVFISAFADILRWRNDEFIVTNRRVIHARGVFSKNILDSSLSKINDVILHQSWLGRMFGYGTIKILTATEEVINLLDNIRDPIAFKRSMLEAKSMLEPAGGHMVTAGPAYSATQLLEELDQLRARKMISDSEFEEKRKEILKRM